MDVGSVLSVPTLYSSCLTAWWQKGCSSSWSCICIPRRLEKEKGHVSEFPVDVLRFILIGLFGVVYSTVSRTLWLQYRMHQPASLRVSASHLDKGIESFHKSHRFWNINGSSVGRLKGPQRSFHPSRTADLPLLGTGGTIWG